MSKRYHVGKQVNLSEDSAYEIYSDEAIAQDVAHSAVDGNK